MSRKRRISFDTVSERVATGSNQSWCERYAPQRPSDLCVAPKKVKEFIALVRQGGLVLLVGNPGIGKSTMVKVVAESLHYDVVTWSESYSFRSPDIATQGSSMDALEAFLQSARTGHDALALKNQSSGYSPRKTFRTKPDPTNKSSLILLDELPPVHHSVEARGRLRRILTDHADATIVPTVLIISDVVEGKCSLPQWIESSMLNAVSVLHILPPTLARFKRCLPQNKNRSAEDLYEQTGGDVRAALLTLQFQTAVPRRTAGAGRKDQRWSTFHALGKLLYAKRVTYDYFEDEDTDDSSVVVATNCWKDGRRPLEFDPERVVEQSESDISTALSFVGSHCVHFFTDSEELGSCAAYLSDAALWLDRAPLHQRHAFREGPSSHSSAYPHGYASSLLSRSVARCNRHPTPNRFRQFNAPKSFQLWPRLREQQVQMDEWCRQMALGSPNHYFSRAVAATEVSPFVRKIEPSATDHMGQFSFFRAPTLAAQDGESLEAERLVQEQNRLFEVDDIDSFEDDDDV